MSYLVPSMTSANERFKSEPLKRRSGGPTHTRLVWGFEDYLTRYVSSTTRLSRHAQAIARLRELGPIAAVTDDNFLDELVRTLNSWHAWRPIPRNGKAPGIIQLRNGLQHALPAIRPLLGNSLEDQPQSVTASDLWTIIKTIPVFGKRTRLVSHSKLLHHVLPDLVVPIDGEYTGWFFGLTAEDMVPSREEATFDLCYQGFREIAKRATPSKYVGTVSPWNSSIGKIIDNAIGGYRMIEKRP